MVFKDVYMHNILLWKTLQDKKNIVYSQFEYWCAKWNDNNLGSNVTVKMEDKESQCE